MNLNIFTKITILVVDDDPFNRQLIISFLSDKPNITIIEAEDGSIALNRLIEHPEIDMLFLDLHMPNLNGKQTLTYIRKEPKYNLIPVIIITTDENELKTLEVFDADDFLFKPFKSSELNSKIYLYMKSRQEKLSIQKELQAKETLPVQQIPDREIERKIDEVLNKNDTSHLNNRDQQNRQRRRKKNKSIFAILKEFFMSKLGKKRS